MAEESQIVNRIVVQGIDEAKAQVQSLKQLLNEAKAGYEQARRSTNERGLFQGATKDAEGLKSIINDIQLQIRRLNTEISQGETGTREKALNEEIGIRQRLAKIQEQQAAKELSDQQRLIEQMAAGRERVMTQAEAREKQMNTAQVARMNSNAEQEMVTRQKALDYESNVRRQLARLAEQQAVVDSIGTVGSKASYAKQMSTLSSNIEEQYRAFKRGAIGSTEYATALDKYTKGMSVAKAEQEAFSKSIGTYTSSWDTMRKRVESHASWILAGGAIAAALAIPSETISQLKEADTLLAKIKQNLELAPRYQGNTSGLEEDVKNLENVAGVFSMAYGQNLKDTMEMMQILSRRFKSPEEITYFTNLALTMAKLDFVKPQKAAGDLEAVILSMGLNFEQSKRFIDEFSVAVHVARITGTELLTGLQRSGATFHNMNFNTAEAISMISTLSTVTAKAGANVGVSLNSMLINVDFKKAAESLQAYGVQVYNSSGKMRDGVEIWRDIAKIFNGLDTQHANEFANAMSGGKFRANDLRALIGNWETFEKILTDVNEKASPELTASLLKTGMNTLATNIQQAQAALQVLGVTIGEQALPQLKEMTIGLATGVQWLNDHKEAVGKTVSAVGEFIKALVLYKGIQILSTGALGGFIETLMLEIRTAPSFSAAIGSMGSAMAGFASTVGLAALRMGAFYAAARMIGELMDSSKQDENEKKFRESIAGKESLSDIEQQTLDALNERDQYVQEKASTTFDTPWGKAAVWLGTSDAESSSIEKEKKFNELNDKSRELLSQSVESSAMEKVNKMVQEAQDKIAAQQKEAEDKLPTIPGVDLNGTGGTGPKSIPTDRSEEIQKKLDNYNVKSIEDQAAIAQDNYKARLDSITAATDRYGKSYAFLNDTTDTMNDRVKSLQATTAALNEQLTSDLEKVNELASSTGVTISLSGTSDGTPEGTAWNYFRSQGYSSELTAGIIGNLMTESGMQTGVRAGDNSGSYGIGQWKDGRLEGLKDFAASLGTSIDDLTTQLAYVDYELKNNESQAFQRISNADLSNPESSAYAVSKYYERPAWAENPERQKNARDIYDKYLYSSAATQQVSVSIPQEVLAGAGITQEAWKGMSAESKKEFISNNKEQIKDAQLLVGYLTQIDGEQKKIAEYQKQITEERKKEYETLVKGIKDIENYQVKQAELSNRTSLASLGYYATDTDKAVAAQQLTKQKLAASNAALEYAKKRGIDIFTDPEMSEERVKNLELQQQLQQESTFATPEARYKQRMSEIEYQQKLTLAGVKGNSTSPYNSQLVSITNLEAAQEKVKALEQLLKDMKASDTFADQTDEFKQYNLQLQEAIKNANELADTYSNKMKQGMYDVTNELLLQGKKISDIWGDLWKQLANDALKALMGIKNDSPGLLAQALGKFGGAKGGTQGGSYDTSKWNQYGDLLGSLMVDKGGAKGGTQGGSYDTSKWNQYGDLLGSLAVDKGTKGELSGSKATEKTKDAKASKSTAWGSILGSLAGLFRANGGVVNSPVIAGEDGEEVIIPVEKNKGNSANLLSYAAGKLGQKSTGLTADFSSKDIAKTAMSVSVNSATNMAKTNGILATQNQILTTMLNQMGKQQGQTNVIVAGGNNSPTIDDFSSMYNTAVSRRSISQQ